MTMLWQIISLRIYSINCSVRSPIGRITNSIWQKGLNRILERSVRNFWKTKIRSSIVGSRSRFPSPLQSKWHKFVPLTTLARISTSETKTSSPLTLMISDDLPSLMCQQLLIKKKDQCPPWEGLFQRRSSRTSSWCIDERTGRISDYPSLS